MAVTCKLIFFFIFGECKKKDGQKKRKTLAASGERAAPRELEHPLSCLK